MHISRSILTVIDKFAEVRTGNRSSGKRIIFSINYAKLTGYPHRKRKKEPSLLLHT